MFVFLFYIIKIYFLSEVKLDYFRRGYIRILFGEVRL